MKSSTLSYPSCTATALFLAFSNNFDTHYRMFALFFSPTKYCYSRNDVRSHLVPFSTLPWSWTWRKATLQTLKIHGKLAKIATTIMFSQPWSRKKENDISQKKKGFGSLWHFNLTKTGFCIKTNSLNYPNRSCVFSFSPLNAKRGCGWSCFDTDLSAFSFKCQLVSIRTTWFTHQKQWGCINKTRSTPASLPFTGQVTEQATVKWSIRGSPVLSWSYMH